MPVSKSEYVSDIWKDGIFGTMRLSHQYILPQSSAKKNQVVFCTGGAGTICSAQVRALVHLGANACIVGRNVEKTERMAKDIATARKGAQVLGMGNVDVRKVESLEAAVETCVTELGGIDYVMYAFFSSSLNLSAFLLGPKMIRGVRRAGAAGNFLAPISHLSPNAMKSVIDIDVLGSYNTLKATLPHLLTSAQKPSTGGRIIFISATLHYTTMPLQTHVSVAKAGVDALSHSVAVEYGPRGLTSNVIAPGPIQGTEGMERLARPEDLKQSMRKVPLGRWGKVKEIADGTVYLFGDAGNFVSGQILVIDGGAWRTTGSSPGKGFNYPDFLLSEDIVSGVKGTKKSKL
ncbi:MAG: hypothetical protein Q9217_006477 [Psora testacea]